MSKSKKLSKLWGKFVKSKDPTILEEVEQETKILVFFIAYNYLQDKKEALAVSTEILLLLSSNQPDTKDFEKWLMNTLCKQLKSRMLSSTDSRT